MIIRFLLLLLLTINVYAETTKPQDGVYQEKFNNGKLKYEISFLNGQKQNLDKSLKNCYIEIKPLI